MSDKADTKGTKGEKPPKVYKLKTRKYKECATCKKPLTSDMDELCAPCALAAAQAKGPVDGTKADPDAFSATCQKCGKGLSSDKDKLCPACAAEPTTLDVMQEILHEVERQNAEDDQITKEVKEKFSIRDHGSANWAAGKIAMWQNEIERRKAQAREYIAEAERNVRRLKFLFIAQLEEWAKANIPQDKKSLKLPSATLKFVDTHEKIVVADEKAAVAWATVNLPDAVEMSTSLQMLKDVWLQSEKKDLPGGCTVVPKETNFKVE
jgi:hypothetical protein